MRLLVVTDASGEIVATAGLTGDEGGPQYAGLIPGPGQTVHEVDVEDDVAASASAAELHEKLRDAVPAPPQLR